MQRTAVFSLIGLALAATPAYAADPFTVIVVPDTQNYTEFADVNDEYNLGQMRWIRNNVSNLNIKFTMHLGDHQNPGNPYRASSTNIYEPDMSQGTGNVAFKNTVWQRASDAITVLDDANVPYSLVPGNHDYLNHDTQIEPWKYLKVFGPQRYINEQASWAANKRTYGGASPAHPVNQYAGMNTYHRFDGGGYKWLNLALQAYPDQHDLRWAQQIINENPGVPTIVTTHVFVAPNGSYQHGALWDKLIKNNPQVVMAFNGHRTGTQRTEDTNIAGLTVQNMLLDYQAVQLDSQLGGNFYRGGGVLHQVQVNPNTNQVTVKAYSPVANRFLPNSFNAFGNDPDGSGPQLPEEYTFRASNFDFDLDLKSRFGLENKGGFVYTHKMRVGVDGYTESNVVDTFIDESAKAVSHQQDKFAWVDGNVTNNLERQGLIRFNLFGSGDIPKGSMIESATLKLHTSLNSEVGNSHTNTPVSIYRLLQTFGEADNWNTRNGYLTDGLEAILAASGTIESSAQGAFVTFDVTESLSAYSAGATNHGWLLRAGGDGWAFDTSEHSNVNFRPELSVTFRTMTAIPEPGSFALVACAGMLALRRRRSAI